MHDSAFGRLIGVLVSPSRTFESIARRPTWVAPMIVLVVLSAAVGVLSWQRVSEDDLTRDMRAAMARQDQTPSEDQLEQVAKISRGAGYGCSALLPPVAYLITALLMMVAFRITGGEIGFPASLSVTLHGFMPWAVGSLLTVPVVLAQPSVDIDQLRSGTLLASSAAAFLPEGSSPIVVALLSSFDLFSFWTLALLTIGYSIVARVSRRRAAGTVVALWLLWIVFKVGMAALGDAFGGGGG